MLTTRLRGLLRPRRAKVAAAPRAPVEAAEPPPDSVPPAKPPADLSLVETGVDDLFGKMSRYGAIALAVFTLWAVIVPIDSAVVAPGAVVSDGKNKVLQSRTGGRIAAIHVRDGQQVAAGDHIVDLDPVEDQANLTKLRARQATLLAMKSRLEAEKRATQAGSGPRADAERDSVVTGTLRDGPEDSELRAEQEREFVKGRAAIDAEVKALRERAEGLKHRRARQTERTQLLRRQIALLEHQLRVAKELARDGHISKQQAWDIEARLIEKRSEYVAVRAEIESDESGISELDAQVRQTTSKDARVTSQQLTDVLGELGQIADQIAAARAAIVEKKVLAPTGGKLVRWTATTQGAVVRPGDVFGEIVPDGSGLEFHARVSPKDITSVAIGQSAKIRISAQALHNADPLAGEVVGVSADSSIEERSQERYFEVRVKLLDDPRSRAALALVGPGMTGETMLLGYPRTFASYMIRPIYDGLKKSFGEQ